MNIGIVGLPNVGKSTLFNALTQSYAAEAANFPFCTIEPNVGRVNVEDPRLELLSSALKSQKIIPASIEFVDIAGIVEGASQGEGLGNKFLSHIRNVDAILQVVRVFSDSNVHHVAGSLDAKRDREIIATELILADLETLQKRMGDFARKAKSGDKDSQAKMEVYNLVLPHLQTGGLAISAPITQEQRDLLQDLCLLTNKPFIYAVNVDESDLNLSETELRNLLGCEATLPIVAISAKLEMDMLSFSYAERKEFMKDLGVLHSPVDTLIQTCFSTLGLAYYFTAGEVETRAWTIHVGWKAPQAAGVIHTDFEKKFIKAEAVFWKDLVDAGSWAAAREGGKVRMEGKDYVVTDGDVLFFKFGG